MPDTRVPLASLPQPTMVIDLQGSMLAFNHAAKDLFGYTHEDCVGWTLSDLLADNPLTVADALLKLSSGEPKVVLQHTRARTRSGAITPVHMTLSVFDADLRSSRTSHVLVTVENVSQADVAAHRASVVIHRDGTIIIADDLFAKHVQGKTSSLIGRNITNFLSDSDLPVGGSLHTVSDFCQPPSWLLGGCYGSLHTVAGGASMPAFFKFIPCADTCVVLVEDLYTRHPGLDSPVLKTKSLSLPTSMSSAWARSVFENIPVILAGMCREHKRIVLWNKAAETVSGYPAEEVMAMPRPMEVLYPDQQSILDQHCTGRADAPPFEDLRLRLRRKDGEERILSWSLVRSDSLSLHAMGISALAIAFDVTDEHNRRRQLEQALQSAEDALKTKSEFLATMSHEIRTPLNGVIGMTGMLLDTPLTLEQKEFTSTARLCATQLLDLVNDILDFSKIEAGRMELEQAPFCFVTICDDIMELMADRAQAKDLDLGFWMEPHVPGTFLGDSARLRQIVANLVTNAVKFTNQGGVVARLKVVGENLPADVEYFRARDTGKYRIGRIVRMRCEVEDSGIGISAEQQRRLFMAFSQCDQSTTRKFGGTGLGLAICKRLVELMGGCVEVSSEPGRGSVFAFEVPLPAPAKSICPIEAAMVSARSRQKAALTSPPAPPGGAPSHTNSPQLQPMLPQTVAAAAVAADAVSPVPVKPLDLVSVDSSETDLEVQQAAQEEEATDFREPVFPIPPTLGASPILIVHTHAPSSEGVASRMRKLTMTDVDIVTTAEEALAAVRRREYRFVLVSRKLEGDADRGLSLSLQLRRVRPTGRPIVVLTRRLTARDTDEVLMAHGVAGVLLEPIRSASMLAVLAALDSYDNQLPAEMRAPASELSWSGASTWPIVRADKHHGAADAEVVTDSLRVLLAEDNQVNQRLAVLCLHKMGHRVDVVSNGREALEQLSRVPYDVVLMDCQMPDVDGYDATRALRQWDGPAARTPVIALTANALQGDRERCLAAGMDDYIAKPFQMEQLQAVIGRVLAKRQQPRVSAPSGSSTVVTPKASGASSGGGAAVGASGSSATEELDSVPVLDQAMIEAFRALDDTGAAWQELVGIFATSMEQRTGSLHALHTRLLEAFRELGTVSHSFKGAAGGVGAMRLARVCQQIETAVQRHSVPSDTVFSLLDREVALARAALGVGVHSGGAAAR